MNCQLALGFATTLLIIFANPTQAQTLYRCGQVFQDKPCQNGSAGTVVGGAAARPPSVITASDPVCAGKGEQAKRIVWAREVGRTRDDQLAAAKTPNERSLIEEVYLLRGRSDEVAAAIAAKCTQDRERERAALAAVLALQPVGAAPTSPTSNANAAADSVKEAEIAAARKTARCSSITNDLNSIQDQERAGGSASTMDSLKKMRRDAETRKQAEGCS